HYVFKQVFGNTCVTFEETPKMILDSASGAGFWSLDMAQECPDAKVISLDMSLAEGSPPRPNIVYKAGNIMSPPLSFAPNTFDFVYQRDVGTVLPLLYWQPLIADFYRILKPKGFVQLVEYDLAIPNYGPYTQAVNRSIGEAIRTTGYDPYFTSSLGTMLHLAGFTNVKRHVVQIPVGEWPEDEVGRQQGFLNRELLKALFRSLRPRLSERLGLKPDSYEESCAAMIREIEENNGSCEVKIFTAQKA
ncbi:S-adenosyl-L-methionine-dependent methyltransferase, partial [Dichotomocladium elegans]